MLSLLCCFVAGLSAVLWHGNAAFTAAFAPEGGGRVSRCCGGGRLLVECGFLSNPEEEQALRDPDYQTRMAAVLAWVCLMDTGAVPS